MVRIRVRDLRAAVNGFQTLSIRSPPTRHQLLDNMLGFDYSLPENDFGNPKNSPVHVVDGIYMFGDVTLAEFCGMDLRQMTKVVERFTSETTDIIAAGVNNKYATQAQKFSSWRKSNLERIKTNESRRQLDSGELGPGEIAGEPDDTFSGEGGDVTNINTNTSTKYGCGNQGSCNNNTCTCQNGWTGTNCHIPPGGAVPTARGDAGCGNWGVFGTTTLGVSWYEPTCNFGIVVREST